MTQQQPRRAARKTHNNVAQSLNRMARVKGNATAWLKGFEKQQPNESRPVSVNFDTQPASSQLRVAHAKSQVTCARVVVQTPISSWSPVDGGGAVHFVCSFCADQSRDVAHVRYNAMLPLAYLLLCRECAQKESEKK